MPRPRQRVCLESGLKLDLNKLRRQGLVSRRREVVARSFDGQTPTPAKRSQKVSLHQTWRISTKAGCESNLGASIKQLLWFPSHAISGASVVFRLPCNEPICVGAMDAPGAERFCSRQAWGRQVAYASQFADPDNRAHIGQAKIKSRLIADLDPDEWDLPPKPKWMRWRTYNRYVQKFDAYEDILSQNIAELMARFLNES